MLDLLQSILAFAVTMLGMATLVTAVLEILSRMIRRRGRVLHRVIAIVLEKEVLPVVAQKQEADSDGLPGGTAPVSGAAMGQLPELVEFIQSSPLKTSGQYAGRGFWDRLVGWGDFLTGFERSRTLTAEEFMHRLSRTNVGTRLLERAGSDWDLVVTQIDARFKELTRASSEWFRSSSVILSLCIGIALALGLNFDGIRVYQFYLDNKHKAEAKALVAEGYLKSYEAQTAALEAVLNSGNYDGDAVEGMADELNRLQKTYERGLEEQEALIREGLPIGWKLFPNCGRTSSDADRERCMSAITESGDVDLAARMWAYFLWAVTIFATGVLIGVGGPFWFDLVSGLLRVTNLMRGRMIAQDQAGEAGQRRGGAAASSVKEGTQALDPAALRALFHARRRDNDLNINNF